MCWRTASTGRTSAACATANATPTRRRCAANDTRVGCHASEMSCSKRTRHRQTQANLAQLLRLSTVMAGYVWRDTTPCSCITICGLMLIQCMCRRTWCLRRARRPWACCRAPTRASAWCTASAPSPSATSTASGRVVCAVIITHLSFGNLLVHLPRARRQHRRARSLRHQMALLFIKRHSVALQPHPSRTTGGLALFSAAGAATRNTRHRMAVASNRKSSYSVMSPLAARIILVAARYCRTV